MWRSRLIRSRSAAGYSVFLNMMLTFVEKPLCRERKQTPNAERPTPNAQCRERIRDAMFDVERSAFSVWTNPQRLTKRRFRQMQRERFQPAQIQLQGRVFFRVRAPRFLKLRVGFSPAFLAIKNDPVPETIAPDEVLRLRLGGEPERVVNFVALLRVHAAEEIDRPGHDHFAGQLECAWPDQDARTIEPVGHAEPASQLDRLPASQQCLVLIVLQRRDNHRTGIYPKVNIALAHQLAVVLPARLTELIHQIERDSHGFLGVLTMSMGETEDSYHALDRKSVV